MSRTLALAAATLALAACQQTLHLYEPVPEAGVSAAGGKSGKGDGGAPDGRCIGPTVLFTPDMVQMVIALDRSQNMDQQFGSDTQLNTALYALTGEVSAYTPSKFADHPTISFSFLDFPDATNGCSAQTGCCASDVVRTSTVTSFENAAYACQSSSANCGSSSHQPIAAALQRADQALSGNQQYGPRYVLLVTDGLSGSAPSGGCFSSSSFNDCTAAIDAMQALINDARVAIVGMGDQTQIGCLMDVSNAGGSAAHYYKATSSGELNDVLGQIMSGAVCNVTLAAPWPSQSDLQVTMGGQPVVLDGMNGWTYDSSSGRLHLHGSSCQNYVQFGWNALQVMTTTCGVGHSGSGGFTP